VKPSEGSRIRKGNRRREKDEGTSGVEDAVQQKHSIMALKIVRATKTHPHKPSHYLGEAFWPLAPRHNPINRAACKEGSNSLTRLASKAVLDLCYVWVGFCGGMHKSLEWFNWDLLSVGEKGG
jgi:hypothetical protein